MPTITIKRNKFFAQPLRDYLCAVMQTSGGLWAIESKSWFSVSFEIKGSLAAIELMQKHLEDEGL